MSLIIRRTHLLYSITPRLTINRTYADLSTSNYGKKQDQHATDKPDELNIQSSASASGKRQKASGESQSSATSEKDSKNDNQRAKEDHPEAPGPVIGMNDERGPKGHGN